MSESNHVMLAICGGEVVPFPFVTELGKIYSKGFFPMVTTGSLYIQLNRANCVKQALQHKGWDYLLFLDTDMIFPDIMMERVSGYTDPIVGGVYFRRRYPDYSPIVGNFVDDGYAYQGLHHDQLIPMLEQPGLYPCDVLGTGCMAIRRDVLEDWPEDRFPIFSAISREDGSEIVTEDVYFCWQAKQQGIQPLLDTGLCCGHIGNVTIGVDTYINQIQMSQMQAQIEAQANNSEVSVA